MMIIKLDTGAVMDKMEELCGAMLEQGAFKELRQSIDRFAEDEHSVQQYERFMEIHQHLQQKEQQDLDLTQEELDHYEQEELALYDNEVIRKFMYAQREFSQLHQMIGHYFTKTVELNRLPAPDELKKGSCGCGGSCGGSH